MDMFILAEITSKWDFSGVMCLAAIPCIIVVLLLYCTGPYTGSCTCLFFFVIAVLATGNMGDAGSGATNFTPNSTYIANLSQTKMLERYKYSINSTNCVFRDIHDRLGTNELDREFIFIPAEERVIIGDSWCIKATGKVAHHYYMLEPDDIKDRDWSKPNSRAYGTWGVPDDYLYKNKAGIIVKLNTGKVPTDDDYYYYDRTISPINVGTKDGGWGVPQWVYHPGASVWIFGLGGLPSLLILRYAKNFVGL